MQLDRHNTYATLDATDIRFGIEHLPEQIRIAWNETRELEFPTSFAKANHIVVAGMGGSALGPHMALTGLANRWKVPMTIVNNYQLPGWVNERTVVIASSFSGNTEEVLEAADEAERAGAMIIALCAGGELAKRAKKKGWGLYQFEPGDFAHQPRFGTGFSFGGMLGVLERAKLVRVTTAEIDRMRIAMGEVIDSCAVDVKGKENPAKTVAKSLAGCAVLVIAAEHLVGAAHVMTNSINETAKQFAASFPLPELNHHLLEGLTYPKTFAPKTVAILFQSSLYHERTQRRVSITADMLEQQGIAVVNYVANGAETLEEVGEVLQFGSFVSYYLGMLNGVRPEEIPFVDAFKEAMGK